MIGNRFDSLVVIREVEKKAVGKKKVFFRRVFECRCDCGNTTEVTQLALNTGNTGSCGCARKKSLKLRNQEHRTDWKGKRYGYLTVTSDEPKKTNTSHYAWKCLCDCGETTYAKVRTKDKLTKTSCGCMTGSILSKQKTVHGLCARGNKSRSYRLYSSLIQRATKKSLLCDFKGKPKEFCEWFDKRILELDNKCPVLGTAFIVGKGRWCDASASIDRIDPSKGYVYGNIDIISHRANQIKNDGTLRELKSICAYIEEVKTNALRRR